MKKIIRKVILAIVLSLILNGCSESVNITFNYNCEGLEEYKCPVLEKKLNCIFTLPKCGDKELEGWYDAKEQGNKLNLDADYEKSMTIYAHWKEERQEDKKEEDNEKEIKKYTITFECNGGSNCKTSSVNVEYGSSMPSISSEIPTRSEYIFMGWYDNSDYTKGTQYYTNTNVSARKYGKISDTTLYAGWKEEKEEKEERYKVTFDCNNGSKCKTSSVDVTYGYAMPEINKEIPTRSGYTFKGWYDKKDGGKEYYSATNESVSVYDKKGNITLYAIWKKREEQEVPQKEEKYIVTFNCNGGSGGPKSQIAIYGKAFTLTSEKCAKIGNSQSAWNEKADGSGEKWTVENKSNWLWNIKRNVTLYAIWKRNKYTVTFNCNGGSNCKTSSVNVEYGSSMPSIGSEIPTRSGYTFMGWYDNSDYTKGTQYYTNTNASARNYNKASNTTLYAIWKRNKYTVTFNCNGGSNCKTSSADVEYGSSMPSIGSEIPTRSGYTFMGWYDNSDYTKGTQYYTNTNTSARNYNKTSNTTLYAGWSKNIVVTKYTVTFNCNGGSNCKTSSVNVEYGSSMPSISSEIPTRSGYTFMGWYDNSDYTKGTQYYTNTNTSARNYNKTSNTTLYAGWKRNKYTVTFNCNGGSNCKTSSVNVEYGSSMPSISSEIPTRSGYTFMGWYDNSDYTKGTQYYTNTNTSARNYNKTSNTTLYAGWKKIVNAIRVASFNIGKFKCGTKSNKPAEWCQEMRNLRDGEKGKYVSEKILDPQNLDIIGIQEAANDSGKDSTPYKYISSVISYNKNFKYSDLVKPLNINATLSKIKFESREEIQLNEYDDIDGQRMLNAGYGSDEQHAQRKIVLETKDYYSDVATTEKEKEEIKYREVQKNGKTYYEYNKVCDWSEPRAMQKIIMNINGVIVSFYNTHLVLNPKEHKYCRAFMIKQTQEILSKDPNPIIYLGDMNATSNGYFKNFLKPIGFEVAAYDTSTNNMWNKASYCDSIYIRPYGLKNGKLDTSRKIDVIPPSEVFETYTVYSDHNMVIANLSITE